MTWLKANSPTARRLRAACFGNGGFCAVGEGGEVVTSVNGISWIHRDSGTPFDLQSVAYGSSGFVAVGTAGVILTSTNASAWRRVTLPSNVAVALNGVAYGGGLYIAVGNGGTVMTTSDLDTWRTSLISENPDLDGVTFGSGKWVGVGRMGAIYLGEGQSAGNAESLRAFSAIEIEFVAKSGVLYSIEASPDLKNWRPTELQIRGTGSTTNVFFRASQERRFFRATVGQP